MYLSILSAVYVILLIIIYFSKEKINTFETKIYGYNIIAIFISLICEFLCSVSGTNYKKPLIPNDLTTKLYLVSLCIWLLIFTVYVFSISIKAALLILNNGIV